MSINVFQIKHCSKVHLHTVRAIFTAVLSRNAIIITGVKTIFEKCVKYLHFCTTFNKNEYNQRSVKSAFTCFNYRNLCIPFSSIWPFTWLIKFMFLFVSRISLVNLYGSEAFYLEVAYLPSNTPLELVTPKVHWTDFSEHLYLQGVPNVLEYLNIVLKVQDN